MIPSILKCLPMIPAHISPTARPGRRTLSRSPSSDQPEPTWPYSPPLSTSTLASQLSRCSSTCFSDHSWPQWLHLYVYWNSSMSASIGPPSWTSRTDGPRNGAIVVRGLIGAGTVSLSRRTSFLLSSLMWNLRPHSGQCLKNSIADSTYGVS